MAGPFCRNAALREFPGELLRDLVGDLVGEPDLEDDLRLSRESCLRGESIDGAPPARSDRVLLPSWFNLSGGV